MRPSQSGAARDARQLRREARHAQQDRQRRAQLVAGDVDEGRLERVALAEVFVGPGQLGVLAAESSSSALRSTIRSKRSTASLMTVWSSSGSQGLVM
jgi:hypothetical protein